MRREHLVVETIGERSQRVSSPGCHTLQTNTSSVVRPTHCSSSTITPWNHNDSIHRSKPTLNRYRHPSTSPDVYKDTISTALPSCLPHQNITKTTSLQISIYRTQTILPNLQSFNHFDIQDVRNRRTPKHPLLLQRQFTNHPNGSKVPTPEAKAKAKSSQVSSPQWTKLHCQCATYRVAHY